VYSYNLNYTHSCRYNLWRNNLNIEKNKIYNIDCSIGLKEMDDCTVDLTLTSPPYDGIRAYNGYSFDFENIAKELFRVTRDGGTVVWIVNDQTIKDNETGSAFMQALYFKEIGFNLHDTMIYHKNAVGACGSVNAYNQAFEYMFVLAKGKMKTFNPLKDIKALNRGRMRNYATNRSGVHGYNLNTVAKITPLNSKNQNVWSYDIGFQSSDKSWHPATFPEKLARDHIVSWSNVGDLILDPFMGSGTTAKIAIMYNRNYIGFEISEEYVKKSEKRLDNIKSGFYYILDAL